MGRSIERPYDAYTLIAIDAPGNRSKDYASHYHKPKGSGMCVGLVPTRVK